MGLYRKATPDELVAPMLHASVETVETVARECALYRHFDEKGALLYVGVALTPASRLRSHVQGSPWARNVATVTIEWFPSRADALAAERGAISGEAPKHNVRRPVDTGKRRADRHKDPKAHSAKTAARAKAKRAAK
jgi:excinuclease UvrABC nuclease subunit